MMVFSHDEVISQQSCLMSRVRVIEQERQRHARRMDQVMERVDGSHLVDEHLVQAYWSEGRLDDVSDGRRCGHILSSDVL